MIRDVSFLGFPAYRIIIPETTYGRCAMCQEKRQPTLYHIQKSLHNLHDCPMNEIKKILKFFEKQNKKGARRIFSKSLRISLLPTDKLRVFDQLLPAALYYKIGQLSRASNFLKNLATETKASPETFLPLFKCARDFLAMVQAQKPMKETFEMLEKFYNKNILFIVHDVFLNDMKWFREFTYLPCPNCAKCKSQHLCKSLAQKELHMKIKKELFKNTIDQARIADIFASVDTKP